MENDFKLEEFLINLEKKINNIENTVNELKKENLELKKYANIEPNKTKKGVKRVAKGQRIVEIVDDANRLENKDEYDKYEKGMDYLAKHNAHDDLLKAIDMLGLAADEGSVDAAFELGEIYLYNEIYLDKELAVEYYLKAAQGGNSEASEKVLELYEEFAKNDTKYYTYLGDIYFEGEIVEKNKDKYIEYYTLSANASDKEAAIKLVKIYKDLALTGDSEASCILGDIYNEGKWVEKNRKKAYEWYDKAEDEGVEKARKKAGEIAVEIGKELLEYEDIKALEWFNIASMKDISEAQYLLGQVFSNGTIVDKDEIRAMEYYKMAAENGNIKAITKVKIWKPVRKLFKK